MSALPEEDYVGIYDAKTHFTSLIEQVLAGKIFTITKHGVPVARIVPLRPIPQTSDEFAEALDEIRSFTAEPGWHDYRAMIGRDEH